MCSKYRFCILFFFSSIGLCFGQQKNQIVATYDFFNREENKIQTVKLWIAKADAYSEFFNITSHKDTLYVDEFEGIYFSKENKDSTAQQYYLTSNSIIFRDHVYTNEQFMAVIVTENMPTYNWKLEKDTISIGGYLCNKATLEFRGRFYNVWYTTEVPTQFGPWKFYGLPGLMVKVETYDKSILFRLSKLEFLEGQALTPPTLGKSITFKEYVNYKEKVIDDFVEKIKSKLPRGATIQVNKTETTSIEKNYD